MKKESKIPLLIVTNMRPSAQKPYSGIFVQNQYNMLLNFEFLKVDIFSMERKFTNKFGSYLKYFVAFIRFFPLLQRNYSVIHLHYYFPLIIPVSLYKTLNPKTKVVVTFHGSDINERINHYNTWIFKIFNKKIDFVVSVGQDLSSMVFKKLNLKSDKIMSAGIDEAVFREIQGVDKKYDFVFAASFIKRKGLDLLIEAIRNINNKKTRYCFVGSGMMEGEILKLKEEFDITLKLNLRQEEMCVVFNESYFHILPSRFEPFGLVATEAMFCGTPSLVTPVGGLKDQLVDGFNGILLSDVSSDSIVEGIRRAMKIVNDQNTYTEMVENCRNSNKEHSLSKIIDETNCIYKSIIME